LTKDSYRDLFIKVIDFIRERYEPNRIMVIEAPTGYGKSIAAPLLYHELIKEKYCFNSIHVLPLRAIIEDYYICKLIQSYTHRLSYCRSPPPKWFKQILVNAGLTINDIAYQMGDLLLRYGEVRDLIKKEPVYDAKYIVSTFDSFAYTIFRIPVTEIFRTIKHYAIPRARIFTSTIIMDEAHLVFREDVDAGSFLAISQAIIKYSSVANTPLILMSATINNFIRRMMEEASDGKIVFFRIWKDVSKTKNIFFIRDRDFESICLNINWKTYVIPDEVDKYRKIVIEDVSSCRKVLFIRFRVKDAIDTYKELIEVLGKERVTLIHGKMDRFDREVAISKANKSDVVVATSVIEAGVDWSFDTLITDHPNPMSIVQQAGRICRHIDGETCDAKVYIIRGKDNSLVTKFINNVSTYGIEWRLPYDVERNGKIYLGTSRILEEYNLNLRYSYRIRESLEQLMTPLFLTSRSINNILRRHNYTLLRTLLTQVLTDVKVLEDLNFERVITFSMTIDLKFLLSKFANHLDSFIAIGVDEKDQLHLIYRKEVSNVKSISDYIELVRKGYGKLAIHKLRPLYLGFILKKGVYRRGEGLV